MISNRLTVTDGSIAGDWIEPGLGGEFGSVSLFVPHCFEAYARIFHPALDRDSNPVKWGEVAEMFGTTPHREMQWHSLLGLADPGELGDPESGWSGQDPTIGVMDVPTLDGLCGILADHTLGADNCYFGLCTIEGWMGTFAADGLKPLLKLPYGREFIVLSGPLAAVAEIVRSGDPPYRDAPNLIWPGDRRWFVITEVDFDSTLVGGTHDLICAILDSPLLEAYEVDPTDSLSADADRRNRHQ